MFNLSDKTAHIEVSQRILAKNWEKTLSIYEIIWIWKKWVL